MLKLSIMELVMPILQSFGPTSTPAIGLPQDTHAVAMRALPWSEAAARDTAPLY